MVKAWRIPLKPRFVAARSGNGPEAGGWHVVCFFFTTKNLKALCRLFQYPPALLYSRSLHWRGLGLTLGTHVILASRPAQLSLSPPRNKATVFFHCLFHQVISWFRPIFKAHTWGSSIQPKVLFSKSADFTQYSVFSSLRGCCCMERNGV